MTLLKRISKPENWPVDHIDRIIHGESLEILKNIPDECVSLVVTSPPYWDFIDYEVEGQYGHVGYTTYINQLTPIWRQVARVLTPNGKLAIVTANMPIPKDKIEQHTRHVKHIPNDIDSDIMNNVDGLNRLSFFIWEKPIATIENMFGSYPFPPNLYEKNAIEFINVYVKDGQPGQLPKEVKEYSKLTKDEWYNLTIPIWPMLPVSNKVQLGHPAPFPTVLPQRLIKMYTFERTPEFEGDIVLDPFNGSGTTTQAAAAAGRRYIGIDLNYDYCKIAQEKVIESFTVNPDDFILDVKRNFNTRSDREASLEL